MKFRVKRTSVLGDAQPCDDAIKGVAPIVDHRGYATPEAFDRARGNAERSWLSKGTNHRLINGTIARDLGYEMAWFINIGSLKALMQFVAEYGEVIVSEGSIEIYDGYRE